MESITDGSLAGGGQPLTPSVTPELHTSDFAADTPRVGSLAARLDHTLGMARDPDFARFWAAESISAVGSQFTAVALPLLAVLTLGASPMAVGVLTAAAGLPHLIFGLFAGAWVDRLRRRPIMIATDVGRAVLLAVIPAAAWFGVLSIELLVVVAFLAESLTVFFDIAYLAYVPTLVPRAQLVEANSKLQASASGAQVVGPALGGTLVRVLGAPFAILFDATTFLASAWFLFRIRTVEPDPARSEGLNVFQEVTQGLGILWRDRRLRALALASGVMNLGGFLFLSVYVLYLTRTLGLGPGAVGLVFALGGVGALAGSLVAGPLRARLGVGMTLMVSLVLFGVFGLTIPLAVLFPRFALPLILASEFLQWVMVLVFSINSVSVRQAITPDRLLGRVNGTMRFVVWGMRPIGSVLGGYLGGHIGLPATLVVGAVGMLVAFVPLLGSPIPGMRGLESGDA
jgi:predicted MFS family arabinose efflux permease